MAMSREQKEQAVAGYQQRFEEDETIVVAHYSGLSVAEMKAFRRADASVNVKVPKNTLAKRALKGTKFEGIADMLSGPTVLASSQDAVAAAKAAYEFAKDNEKLIIIGGAMGSQVLDKAGVEALAKMPSLDELRAKLVGLLQAPATKVAGVTQAPAGQLARVIGAYAAKG